MSLSPNDEVVGGTTPAISSVSGSLPSSHATTSSPPSSSGAVDAIPPPLVSHDEAPPMSAHSLHSDTTSVAAHTSPSHTDTSTPGNRHAGVVDMTDDVESVDDSMPILSHESQGKSISKKSVDVGIGTDTDDGSVSELTEDRESMGDSDDRDREIVWEEPDFGMPQSFLLHYSPLKASDFTDIPHRLLVVPESETVMIVLHEPEKVKYFRKDLWDVLFPPASTLVGKPLSQAQRASRQTTVDMERLRDLRPHVLLPAPASTPILLDAWKVVKSRVGRPKKRSRARGAMRPSLLRLVPSIIAMYFVASRVLKISAQNGTADDVVKAMDEVQECYATHPLWFDWLRTLMDVRVAAKPHAALAQSLYTSDPSVISLDTDTETDPEIASCKYPPVCPGIPKWMKNIVEASKNTHNSGISAEIPIQTSPSDVNGESTFLLELLRASMPAFAKHCGVHVNMEELLEALGALDEDIDSDSDDEDVDVESGAEDATVGQRAGAGESDGKEEEGKKEDVIRTNSPTNTDTTSISVSTSTSASAGITHDGVDLTTPMTPEQAQIDAFLSSILSRTTATTPPITFRGQPLSESTLTVALAFAHVLAQLRGRLAVMVRGPSGHKMEDLRVALAQRGVRGEVTRKLRQVERVIVHRGGADDSEESDIVDDVSTNMIPTAPPPVNAPLETQVLYLRDLLHSFITVHTSRPLQRGRRPQYVKDLLQQCDATLHSMRVASPEFRREGPQEDSRPKRKIRGESDAVDLFRQMREALVWAGRRGYAGCEQYQSIEDLPMPDSLAPKQAPNSVSASNIGTTTTTGTGTGTGVVGGVDTNRSGAGVRRKGDDSGSDSATSSTNAGTGAGRRGRPRKIAKVVGMGAARSGPHASDRKGDEVEVEVEERTEQAAATELKGEDTIGTSTNTGTGMSDEAVKNEPTVNPTGNSDDFVVDVELDPELLALLEKSDVVVDLSRPKPASDGNIKADPNSATTHDTSTGMGVKQEDDVDIEMLRARLRRSVESTTSTSASIPTSTSTSASTWTSVPVLKLEPVQWPPDTITSPVQYYTVPTAPSATALASVLLYHNSLTVACHKLLSTEPQFITTLPAPYYYFTTPFVKSLYCHFPSYDFSQFPECLCRLLFAQNQYALLAECAAHMIDISLPLVPSPSTSTTVPPPPYEIDTFTFPITPAIATLPLPSDLAAVFGDIPINGSTRLERVSNYSEVSRDDLARLFDAICEDQLKVASALLQISPHIERHVREGNTPLWKALTLQQVLLLRQFSANNTSLIILSGPVVGTYAAEDTEVDTTRPTLYPVAHPLVDTRTEQRCVENATKQSSIEFITSVLAPLADKAAAAAARAASSKKSGKTESVTPQTPVDSQSSVTPSNSMDGNVTVGDSNPAPSSNPAVSIPSSARSASNLSNYSSNSSVTVASATVTTTTTTTHAAPTHATSTTASVRSTSPDPQVRGPLAAYAVPGTVDAEMRQVDLLRRVEPRPMLTAVSTATTGGTATETTTSTGAGVGAGTGMSDADAAPSIALDPEVYKQLALTPDEEAVLRPGPINDDAPLAFLAPLSEQRTDVIMRAYLAFTPAYSPAQDVGVPKQSLVVADLMGDSPEDTVVRLPLPRPVLKQAVDALQALLTTESTKTGVVRTRERAVLPLRHMLRDSEDALTTLPAVEDHVYVYFRSRMGNEPLLEALRRVVGALPVEMCPILYGRKTRDERRVVTVEGVSGEVNLPSAYGEQVRNGKEPDVPHLPYGQGGVWSDRDVFVVVNDSIPLDRLTLQVARGRALRMQQMSKYAVHKPSLTQLLRERKVQINPQSWNVKTGLANPLHPYNMLSYALHAGSKAFDNIVYYDGGELCTCGQCSVLDSGVSTGGGQHTCARDRCRCCFDGSLTREEVWASRARHDLAREQGFHYGSVLSINNYPDSTLQDTNARMVRRLLGVAPPCVASSNATCACECGCHTVKLSALDYVPIVRRRKLDVKSYRHALVTDEDHDSSDEEDAETASTGGKRNRGAGGDGKMAKKKKDADGLPKLPDPRLFHVPDTSLWIQSLLTLARTVAVTVDMSLFPHLPIQLMFTNCNVLGLELHYKASSNDGAGAGTHVAFTKYGAVNMHDVKQSQRLAELTAQDSDNTYRPEHYRATRFLARRGKHKRTGVSASIGEEGESDMLENRRDAYLQGVGVIGASSVVVDTNSPRTNTLRFDLSIFDAVYKVDDGACYDRASLVRFAAAHTKTPARYLSSSLFRLVESPKLIDVASFGNVISEVDIHRQITRIATISFIARKTLIRAAISPTLRTVPNVATAISQVMEESVQGDTAPTTVSHLIAHKTVDEKKQSEALHKCVSPLPLATQPSAVLENPTQHANAHPVVSSFLSAQSLPRTHTPYHPPSAVQHANHTPSILSTASAAVAPATTQQPSQPLRAALSTPLSITTTVRTPHGNRAPATTLRMITVNALSCAATTPSSHVIATARVAEVPLQTHVEEVMVGTHQSREAALVHTVYHDNVDVGVCATADNAAVGVGQLIERNGLMMLKNDAPENRILSLNSVQNNSLMKDLGVELPVTHDYPLVPPNAVALSERVVLPVGTKTGFFADIATLLHSLNDKGYHYESPQRVLYLLQYLHLEGIFTLDNLAMVQAQLPTIHDILLTHRVIYLQELFAHAPYATQEENNDYADNYNSVYLTALSPLAALVSVGGLLAVTRQVVLGELRNGFCVTRPPGHHCDGAFPSGFCLLNNVSIAAQYAVSVLGLERVLIVDWDIHYGDGTQELFDNNSNVFVFNVHMDRHGSFFPALRDNQSVAVTGSKQGEGACMNVTWHKDGMGDGDYLHVTEQLLLPLCDEYAPQLIIVSAGFDGGRGDPLGKCNVTPECYARITHQLMSYAKGKVVLALEGGYNQHTVAASSSACIKALTGRIHEVPPMRPCVATSHCIEMVAQAKRVHEKYWASLRKR